MNSSEPKTAYSSQFTKKAIRLETTTTMAMNFAVSTAPHSRSRYLSVGVNVTREKSACARMIKSNPGRRDKH
jgi:hypothetical protein